MKEFLTRRITHAASRTELHLSVDDIEMKDRYAYHRGYIRGYWKGLLSAYENSLDYANTCNTFPVMTTGEMLDAIDAGQIAERIYESEGYCSDRYTKLKIDDDGDLWFYDEQENSWEYEKLTGAMIKSQWRIVEEE